MTMDRREIVAIDIQAPAAKVWQHLRQPDLVRRWYRWDAPDLDAHVRDFVAAHEGRDAASRHTLTWHNHDVLTVGAAEHRPDVTHVTVSRTSHDLAAFDGVQDFADAVWIAGIEQLRFAITVHPGQPRRTLSSFGLDAGDPRDRTLDRAGLHGVRGIPLGGNVQARRPDGTLLGGTLLRKTEDLIVLHLHGITQAMLVLIETPAASAPPHGTVGAVLSTYGLDDETFEQVLTRWSAWWQLSLPRVS